MQLGFGRSRGVPEDVKTAWGARLIAPADLLWDRQDLVAESDEAKAELIAWLNGTTPGKGAISKALDWLRENYWRFAQDDEQITVYEDLDGIIVGSTQGSGGYVYLAGWLRRMPRETDRWPLDSGDAAIVSRMTEIAREHAALYGVDGVDHYEVTRMPITVERWHTHYGWSEAEAEKFGEGSSEVRVFAVYPDGARRELESSAPVKGQAGQFEMGYGGSGPHETARAIVTDREPGDRSPADLRRLVPEVFEPAGRESQTLVIGGGAVDERLGVC